MLDFWFKNCFFASNFTFYGVKSGLFKIKKVHPQNEIIRWQFLIPDYKNLHWFQNVRKTKLDIFKKWRKKSIKKI